MKLGFTYFITPQSERANNFISKLKITGSRYATCFELQTFSNKFQCTQSKITFSAMGFFGINYSTLCGVRILLRVSTDL